MNGNSQQGFVTTEPWYIVKGPRPSSSRKLVGNILHGQPEDTIFEVQRAATELITNAYRHAMGMTDSEIQGSTALPKDVVLELGVIERGATPLLHLRVVVNDPSTVPPDWGRDLEKGESMAESGRGLALTRQDAERYGHEVRADGKSVMAEFLLDPTPFQTHGRRST